MTDNGIVLNRATALYYFHEAILDLESCELECDDLREVEQGVIRLHNLLKKYRSRHVST